VRTQAVVEASGVSRRIGAPVADEYFRHASFSYETRVNAILNKIGRLPLRLGTQEGTPLLHVIRCLQIFG
jgi:hypothetical protein